MMCCLARSIFSRAENSLSSAAMLLALATPEKRHGASGRLKFFDGDRAKALPHPGGEGESREIGGFIEGGFFGVGNAHLEEFAAPFARTVPRRFASGIHSGSVSETS